jgi:hypothetical protein
MRKSQWSYGGVKTATFSFVVAIAPAQDLGQKAPWIGSPRQEVTMVTVRRKEIVALSHAGDSRHSGCLLPDVNMVVAPEVALIIETDEGLFEMADEKHSAEKFKQIFPCHLRKHDSSLFKLP